MMVPVFGLRVVRVSNVLAGLVKGRCRASLNTTIPFTTRFFSSSTSLQSDFPKWTPDFKRRDRFRYVTEEDIRVFQDIVNLGVEKGRVLRAETDDLTKYNLDWTKSYG